MNVLNNTLTREMVTILLLRKGDLLLNLGQFINGIFLIGLLTWSTMSQIASRMKNAHVNNKIEFLNLILIDCKNEMMK